jgi:1-deoxy-D-xylulose-5-phosphate reductoisomerase
VAFTDSGVLAQVANADMRVPIAYALGYPDRIVSGVRELDFSLPFNLTFYPPEIGKYPCFDLAKSALKKDCQADMIVLNAADEAAVFAFMDGRIAFTDINSVVEKILNSEYNLYDEPNTVDDVLEIDRRTRARAGEILSDYKQ